MCIGDFNRPLQAKKLTHGTKLLNEWLIDEKMILVNDKKVNTRVDPARGTGSVLDLALVSANIESNVTNFLFCYLHTALGILKKKFVFGMVDLCISKV